MATSFFLIENHTCEGIVSIISILVPHSGFKLTFVADASLDNEKQNNSNERRRQRKTKAINKCLKSEIKLNPVNAQQYRQSVVREANLIHPVEDPSIRTRK